MSKSKTQDVRDRTNKLADRLAPHVENARDKAGPLLADARDKAGPMVADARDKAGPLLADARDKAGPMIADARDKAAPYVADARDKFNQEVLPVIGSAIVAASEATEDFRAEARKRGLATAAALKGEVQPPENKHRLRTLLIVLGLGGVAAFVAKRMSDRVPSTAWQSSYTPPPPPDTSTDTAATGTPTSSASPSTMPASANTADDETPTATAAAAATGTLDNPSAEPVGNDEGGSAPDVAAADAATGPHAATTPDDPAEDIDLKKD